jgi:hypothetical protein
MGMNILPTLYKNRVIVICAQHAAKDQITTLTAELAVHGAVTILDGGNRFAAYQTVRMLRKLTTDLVAASNRIFIRRAFTCYQMLALLESTPPLQQPCIILDLLAAFYDENVQLREARRLLDRCILQLQRLKLTGPVVVTLAPPLPERSELYELIRSRGDQLIDIEVPFPVMAQPALF